jgi:Zn-finger protein
MKPTKLKLMNDQSNSKGHGQHEQHQRCELCNVPIFRNPCSDERNSGVFNGKGKMLCNKCAITLAKIPTEQALKALDNAAETYKKE